MNKFFSATCLIGSTTVFLGASMGVPFSLSEIRKIDQFPLKQPSFMSAQDGCKLAYYPYVSSKPKALVLLYPGAGMYGNLIYQHVGKKLLEDHSIGSFVIDIRGHGNSGGARGDAPTIEAVWQDVSDMVSFARTQYGTIPIYLVGHSSGAGMLLNYSAWPKQVPVDGLILLAPYLGSESGTLKKHEHQEQNFVKKVRIWVYIVAGISNGYFCSHIPAVYFNYPEEVLKDKKIVSCYTYTMSSATTPYRTKAIFESIHTPIGMIIAADDEQFLAESIAQYAHHLPLATTRYVDIILGQKHLGLLCEAPTLINRMIERFVEK